MTNMKSLTKRQKEFCTDTLWTWVTDSKQNNLSRSNDMTVSVRKAMQDVRKAG